MTNISDIFAFITQAYFAGRPRWTSADIPDLTGKTVIVTGGSSGIGKETVKRLLQHNAKVYLAARNLVKSETVIEELFDITGRRAIFLYVDLADLVSIKTAAAGFLSKEHELHILFNNGGVMMSPVDQLTVQGYDLQFGTNVLGHFYFTQLLLPLLMSTAKNSATGSVRVVNTSSSGHYLGLWNPVDFGTLKDGPKRRRWPTCFLYFQSKFGNVVFSNELARRYGEEGIISISLNPGNIEQTDLTRHLQHWWERLGIFALQIYPPPWGALTQLWAGTSPEVGGHMNGKFLGPWCRAYNPQVATLDPTLGQELWRWMEQQVQDV